MHTTYSVALTGQIHDGLMDHLLKHYRIGERQEDLCFALWYPSTGASRLTALIGEPIYPEEGDRDLHGNASFHAAYFERAASLAVSKNAGLAFLHSHPTSGWQGMSPDDVYAEQTMLAPRVFGATGLPLVGMTVGTDAAWSARFWPRVGIGKYRREWCKSVRVVADKYQITFCDKLLPPPQFREELTRTYSSWGTKCQQDIARLKVGIVGLGSVGALVAECLARHGIEDVLLLDFDEVERHNLDRLLHANAQNIGKKKVDLACAAMQENSTAQNIRVFPFDGSITSELGFRAALDCDVLFSCVDRPWARSALNLMAYAHLIPVIDGGVRVSLTRKSGAFRDADWRSHTAMPGRRCLACLGQYDPADVVLERSGMLNDPSYTEGLPNDHFSKRSENVFGFSMAAASLEFMQFLALFVAPYGLAECGAQIYHFAGGFLEKETLHACEDDCLYDSIVALGDRADYMVYSES